MATGTTSVVAAVKVAVAKVDAFDSTPKVKRGGDAHAPTRILTLNDAELITCPNRSRFLRGTMPKIAICSSEPFRTANGSTVVTVGAAAFASLTNPTASATSS